MSPRKARALLASLLAIALAALPAAAATLRWAAAGDISTMDPHANNEGFTNFYHDHIFEPLVTRGKDLKVEPALAVSWQQLSPTQTRFKLRPNVKFHEGEAFTADDVVFNVERALMPTSAHKSALPNVRGARKVDELTVDILTSVPTPVLPLAISNLRLMSKAWSVKHKVEKPQDYKAREESYAVRNADGTGPFRLVRWDNDVKTVLVANDKYYGKRGNVTEATYFVVGSAATRAAALLSGEMDIVVDPAVQDIDRLRANPAVTVGETMGTGTQFLGFDHARDKLAFGDAGGRNPFRDPRVRQAVWLAIDTNALQAKVMRGTGGTGRSIFSPAVDGYDKRFDEKPLYDPVRAKTLLKEAGYPDGFSVDLDGSAQQPADAICQAIAGMLSRVGIRATYRPLPFNILLPKLTSGDTSLYVLGWTPATVEPEGVLVPLAHSRSGPGLGEYNFGHYSNPKVDALIDQGRVEFDPAKRASLFTEAMSLMDQDAAFVPLIHRHVTWAMRRNVKAVLRPNDIVDLRFVNIQ